MVLKKKIVMAQKIEWNVMKSYFLNELKHPFMSTNEGDTNKNNVSSPKDLYNDLSSLATINSDLMVLYVKLSA